MIRLIEDPDDGTGRPYWHTTEHKASDAWSVIGSPDEGYHIEDATGCEFELDQAEEDHTALGLVIDKLRELQADG